MATTDDPRGDVRQYGNERSRVERADLDETDREAILAFGDRVRGKHQPSTAVSQMANCRKCAAKAHALGLSPVVEWDDTTFDRFMVRMADADLPAELLPARGGWSEGTLRNYKQHVKNLLVDIGHGWAEDIPIGAPPKPSVERDDLLTQDELTALWEAAEHPRDECLIALPLTTWLRNAALRALRVCDVHLPENGRTGHITVNDSALGQKGADGARPLTWATGPVERWLAKHPARVRANGDDDPTPSYTFDPPDAPLLCVITDAGDSAKGAALSTAEVYNRRLRTLAERAGLDRDRWDSSHGRRQRTIRAHILRYTGATRAAISDEYNDTTVKKWAGWAMDTPQLKRYIQVVEEDVLASADAAHGIVSALPERPAFDNCPKCGAAIEEWHRACPTCTVLLSDEAFAVESAADAIHGAATEDLVDEATSDSPDEKLVTALKGVRDATTDREAFAALVADALAGMDADE